MFFKGSPRDILRSSVRVVCGICKASPSVSEVFRKGFFSGSLRFCKGSLMFCEVLLGFSERFSKGSLRFCNVL